MRFLCHFQKAEYYFELRGGNRTIWYRPVWLSHCLLCSFAQYPAAGSNILPPHSLPLIGRRPGKNLLVMISLFGELGWALSFRIGWCHDGSEYIPKRRFKKVLSDFIFGGISVSFRCESLALAERPFWLTFCVEQNYITGTRNTSKKRWKNTNIKILQTFKANSLISCSVWTSFICVGWRKTLNRLNQFRHIPHRQLLWIWIWCLIFGM